MRTMSGLGHSESADFFEATRPRSIDLSVLAQVINHSTFKRRKDVLLAILLIVFLSPALLLIALAIFLDSPGPVLFRQERYGKDRKIFSSSNFAQCAQRSALCSSRPSAATAD